MPNPISGNAVANAATQLRIINLDQVLDSNISTSMNFAIDFPNQTFRMTGLQLTDWLTDNLIFNAVDVDFDNTVLVSLYPTEPNPAQNSQDAIDFVLGEVFETQENYLPLAGGTLTGDGELLILKAATSAAVNTAIYSNFGTLLAEIGKVDTSDDIWIDSKIADLNLRSTVSVNIIAPLVEVTGDIVAFAGAANEVAISDFQAGSSSVPGAGGTLQITLAKPYIDATSYAVAISYNVAGASSDAGVYVTKDSGTLFTITNDTSAPIALDWITNKLTQ